MDGKIAPAKPARILLVLSENGVHEARLASAVFGACRASRLHIVYAGSQDGRTQLSLGLLMALFREAGFGVTLQALDGPASPDAVRAVYKPGDVVVCLAGHMFPEVHAPRKRMRPMAAFLRVMHMPVIELTGCEDLRQAGGAARARILHDWLPALVILCLSVIQIWVITSSTDPDAPAVRAFLFVSATAELLCLGVLFTS